MPRCSQTNCDPATSALVFRPTLSFASPPAQPACNKHRIFSMQGKIHNLHVIAKVLQNRQWCNLVWGQHFACRMTYKQLNMFMCGLCYYTSLQYEMFALPSNLRANTRFPSCAVDLQITKHAISRRSKLRKIISQVKTMSPGTPETCLCFQAHAVIPITFSRLSKPTNTEFF